MAYRHHRVQRLRRLLGRRNVRIAEGCFVVEGAKVLREALGAGAPVESVYLDPAGVSAAETDLAARCLDLGCRVFELDEGVLARVADTATPQPILAVVSRVDLRLDQLMDRTPALVVVCVDLRDPGNAGTVVRSAEASGAGGVIFCGSAVDPFNPKAVRASAGTIFHVPIVMSGGDAEPILDELQRGGLCRYGTVARGGIDYTRADLARPSAIVVGNEAYGLPAGVEGHLDQSLTIPMQGRAESLNVSMAVTVLCFEAARQRRAAAG